MSDKKTFQPKNTETLLEEYKQVRNYTLKICEPLQIEDYVVQPAPEVSPPKWHLAHTTWFFEELILVKFDPNYKRFNNEYRNLFNSYYKRAGKHWIQSERGHLSRPSVAEIKTYRDYVDEKLALLLQTSGLKNQDINFHLEVGIEHEKQHQELLLMDIKYILAANPLALSYIKGDIASKSVDKTWFNISEGVYEIGNASTSFQYDNEGPKHKTYIQNMAMQNQFVSNGEYLEFINSGAYQKPEYWLSQAWDWLQEQNIEAPLYWSKQKEGWYEYSLYGLKPLDKNAPLCHISFFEANAFANWTGYRLPTEQEYEVYLSKQQQTPMQGDIHYHPNDVGQVRNQVWAWTSSHYSPYPGFRSFQGMLEEYNAKFMCNQFVLRGGCVASPSGHVRDTYRNFYQAHDRWMFSGIRLVKDLD